MNLRERIARRQRTEHEPRLVHDYDAVNPVVHPDEPTGRGPVLEQLLDHIEPVFEGVLPPNFYVWGPKGTGKSAVVTALFSHLDELSGRPKSVILTTTRAEPPRPTEFVYLDARDASSDFALSHAVLDALVEESVPKHGVGTAEIRTRLQRELGNADRRVLVAVDHLDEPETHSFGAIAELFSPVDDALSIVGVGRRRPAEIDTDVAAVRFPPYRHHALVDILTSRVSNGLARHALTHEQVREVAEWADGDAHDALAALFGAADQAMVAGHNSVLTADLDAGMDAVPRPCVSLGRVLALPTNRQRVLRRLLELNVDERSSVQAASEQISRTVDLSAATVKRILYELAESGITRRVTVEEAEGKGRPPSRLEPRFPTAVFERLFSLNGGRE
ncbi:Cdc6-related protein, AAA superfamily ATPase [Halogranum amylolyticum]|uniref:Cdc6-related protein, AAA superfamily ATPase n=1 Tax=Halogranum amylolyticum TaxID=660520 RepID=A0A1H8SW17_9EURY|nr:AAA family ATPase [Halogranum amylolyticum]SEO82548.1 Cdc6-related protein, AAA superfamily ATPase [Halogranum amylolyticum]